MSKVETYQDLEGYEFTEKEILRLVERYIEEKHYKKKHGKQEKIGFNMQDLTLILKNM
jgi:hypothetical protein